SRLWQGALVRMLVVETVAKIRRAYFGQGKSIKAICRELRISRKVVRKVLRSETTEFRYERERQPMPAARGVAWGAGSSADGQRGAIRPGAADANPGLRGIARAGLRGRLRRCAAGCANLAMR